MSPPANDSTTVLQVCRIPNMASSMVSLFALLFSGPTIPTSIRGLVVRPNFASYCQPSAYRSSVPLVLQRKGMLRDHQFLVGGLDQEQDPALRLRDDPLARRIVCWIQDGA